VKKALTRNSMLLAIVTVVLGIVFFSTDPSSQDGFGLEENFVTLQTGIISTQDRDFAVSNDFEIRIFQNEKIMRLSGVTTTGEPYYIYQKNIGGDIMLKGKILLEGFFVSIIQKEIIPEPQVSLEPGTQLVMSTKIPHHTYASYPVTISVKVFDAEQNPQANYNQKFGALEDIFVNVTITNKFDKVISSLSGYTDSTGLFRGSHVVREGIDLSGEYKVVVTIDDGTTSTSKFFKTFFRGDIRDYWNDNNP
jgi:hypothetical protein